jgi:hypothetical protein
MLLLKYFQLSLHKMKRYDKHTFRVQDNETHPPILTDLQLKPIVFKRKQIHEFRTLNLN